MSREIDNLKYWFRVTFFKVYLDLFGNAFRVPCCTAVAVPPILHSASARPSQSYAKMGDISQSTRKTKSRVLAALDDSSVLSSSSSSHTTMQTSQTVGKRKLLGDVPIVPGSRAQIIPDTGYMVLGPQSPSKKPRHACKRAADIRQLSLIS